MTKVLIIRLSSIGDIVLTTPVIRNLKQQGPQDLALHFIIKKQYQSVLQANPHIDKLWLAENNINELIPELVKEQYDYVIDLHHNLRSLKIKKKLQVEYSSVDKVNIQKWIWVNTGINLMPEAHIVDRYMDCLDHFGISNDGKGLDFFIPKEDEVNVSSIASKLQANDYIAWAIGATYDGKKLSVKKTIKLLRKINHPVILMGGPMDEKDGKTILENVPNHIHSAIGKFSIPQSASIIRQARMVVTPDTGLMHIASAFKKNIVSIWGCTTPGLGMSAYMPGDKSIIIEPLGLKRRPCSKLGNHCKYKGGCINRIENDAIVRAIEEVY